jgi:uncharacterized protein with von Willebrand factor type A (vWA) domain
MDSINDQILGPVIAEDEAPEIVFGAITDGSQAIAHDGYDVENFERAAGDYTRMADTLEETSRTIHTGPALLRDLFWGFHKRAPRIAPVAPLSPAHEINRQIIDQIFSTAEWREMRESGTVGDCLSSAMAMIGVSNKAIAALGDETIKQINQLHELSSEVDQLFARAETLKELSALSRDEGKSKRLEAEAEAAIADAENKEKKIERLNRELEETGEDRDQDVRRAVRTGLAEALCEIEQTNDAIKALSGGYEIGFGFEKGFGGRNGLSTKEKIAIAQRVGKSPKLQRIAAICGRFTRIALGQQKTRVKHPPDEITSITIGDQIERLLPSEIALLSDKTTEDLFYLKFAEHNLMQYDPIGHEPEGQGPIIVAIDESGSMTTDYGGLTGEVWSKSVMLALLSIARLQKRDLAVIHFSGSGDLKLDLFPKGEAAPVDVITCADHFFNGGTVFEPWMNKALELVDSSQFEKADVICISDGVTSISSNSQAEWMKRRADRGMRAYGILIGEGPGEELLGSITDAVFRLEDLHVDLSALETIFSI